MLTRSLAILLLPLCFASACGGTAGDGMLAATFPDNQTGQIAKVLERLAAAPQASARPVVVSMNNKPTSLVAYDLASGQRLWERHPANPHSAALVAGNMVVTHENDEVVARAIDTGSELFSVDDHGLHLIGAAGADGLGAIVLSTGLGVGAESRLILSAGGHVTHDVAVSHSFGAPALAAGMVFLPWDNQNVSVLDAKSGEEMARIRIRDDVVSRALVVGKDAYAGNNGVFRVTDQIASGTKAGSAYFVPKKFTFPGNPQFLWDGYKPPPGIRGAEHSVRLAWSPVAAHNGVALANGNLYFVYYRVVLAIEPSTGAAHWGYVHNADIVGVEANEAGLFIGDTDGKVTLLDAAHGDPMWTRDLSRVASAMTFRAADFRPRATLAPSGASLPEQLAAVGQAADARLVAARVLAVDLLAAVDDPTVTGNLVSLCENRRAPKVVREKACVALGNRASGADDVMLALSRHAGFLEDTSAPPVGALGLASVKMKQTDALPLLLAHLRDPHTPSDELPNLMAALLQFHDRSAAGPIRDFLRLYHAEQWEADLTKALVTAVDALLAIQGPASRETLEELANDPSTMSEVASQAAGALAKLDAETQKAANADEAREQEQEDNVDVARKDPRPTNISADMMKEVLAPVQDKLDACARKAKSNARIVITVNPDGTIAGVSVGPATLQACMEPLVRAHTFPATRTSAPAHLTYNVKY